MRSWSKWVVLVGVVFLGVAVIGCQPDLEPIERGTNAMIDKVVSPAIEKASAELTARTAQYQGQGSLINPGYRIQGYAGFGPCVLYNFEINAVGVSGNVAGATQQDAGQAGSVPPPAMRDTQPNEPTQ